MIRFISLVLFSAGNLIFSMNDDYFNIFDTKDDGDEYLLPAPDPGTIPKPMLPSGNPSCFLATVHFFWELHVPAGNTIAKKLFDEGNFFLPKNNAEKDAISFMFKPFANHSEVTHENYFLQVKKIPYKNQFMYYTQGFFKVYIPFAVYVRCALALHQQEVIHSFNDYVLLYVLRIYTKNHYNPISTWNIQFLVQEILSNNRKPSLSDHDEYFAKYIFPDNFLSPKLGDTLGKCFEEDEKDEKEVKIISVMKQYHCNVERVYELW